MLLEQKLPQSSLLKTNITKDCFRILEEEQKFDSRKQTYVGQRVYILSESSFQIIKTIIVNSIFFTTTLINQSIVLNQQQIIYSHYDHILKKGVGERVTDQLLKIRIISAQMNQLIFHKLKCSGFQLQRKVIKKQGKFQVEFYPYLVECLFITSELIKNSSEIRYSNNNISLNIPQMDKYRFNFFQSETIHDLKTKIQQKLQQKCNITTLQIFAYDSSLFQIVSINRYIEYFLLKEDIEQCTNVRQRNFYELIHNRNNDEFLVEFFPGKLLSDEPLKYLTQNKIKTLIVDGYVGQKWVFPAEQPSYSMAKDCSFCVLKSQLYLLFDCQHCGNSLMFCSRVCQYQGLLEHQCPQAKQQLVCLYSAQSIKNIKFNQSVREMAKKEKENLTNTSKMKERPQFFISNANNSLPQLLKTDEKKEDLLPCGGLYNLGNTCYMNAVIQSLAYTSLTQNLIGSKFALKYSKLVREYTHLLNLLQKTQTNSYLSCQKLKQFKQTLDNQMEYFQGYGQHDAHEFMTVFIDKLHSELKTKINMGENEAQLSSLKDKDDQEEGRKQWLKYIKDNGHSHVLHLFYGQMKSQIYCSNCKNNFRQFNTFNILQLSIPNHFDETTISFYYEYYQFRQKTKQITINLSKNLHLNDILIIISMRLKQEQVQHKKQLKAFLLSYQGVSINYNKQIKIKQIEKMMDPLKSKENQLFIIETIPQKNVFIIFKFIQPNKKPFTFKRPVFFNQSVDKITNIKLYQASIQYLLVFAKKYNKIYRKYKEKVKERVTQYIKLRLYMPNKQDGNSSNIKVNWKNIQNDTNITIQLCLQGSEVWVELQKFNKYDDQLDIKFYNSITEKMSKCVIYKEIQIDSFNQDGQVIQLQKCIEEQLSKNELLGLGNEWFCSFCNQKRRVYKSTHLYKTPQYLIVHLKRFMKKANENNYQKNNCKIKTPLVLNLASVLKNYTLPQKYYTWFTPQQTKMYELSNIQPNTSQSCRYQLKSLILHTGTLESGHYIALTSASDHNWREYNDQNVTQVNIKQILNIHEIMQRVYILIYQRMEQ